MGSVTYWGPLDTSFLLAQIVGAWWPQKTSVLGPKTLHYAKIWAQNATKTSAGNIPESLSNLFLRDNCRLLQRLLNNALPGKLYSPRPDLPQSLGRPKFSDLQKGSAERGFPDLFWGPKGVSTKGVSMKRPNFPYFRAFYTVVPKGDFQKSPRSWIPLLWRPFWSFPTSDLFWKKKKKTNRKKSEENGANRNKSGHSRKQGAQIGTNRKKTGKSEQIGTTPFWRPQSGGSEVQTMVLDYGLRPWFEPLSRVFSS